MNDSDEDLAFIPQLESVINNVRRRRYRQHLNWDLDEEIFTFINYMRETTSESDPEMLMDQMMEEDLSRSSSQHQPPCLMDIAAQRVARNYKCETLEFHDPPLDEALLKKVAYWAFPQDELQVRAFAIMGERHSNWNRGISILKDGRVKEMWQVGFMATAYISKVWKSEPSKRLYTRGASNADEDPESADNTAVSDIRVSLTFERQQILSSSCSECKDCVWCAHIIAAVAYRIRNADQIRVHAPMTETLSTLNREQLQKLMQYAVQEDPAGILGKIFKHLDSIRDNTSEMSTTQGAPDPTFGGLTGSKTQWQLSLDTMEKNLEEDLLNMTSQRSSFFDIGYNSGKDYYPDNYDLSKKFQSKMYHYVLRVLDLVRQRQWPYAAQVLCMIVNCLVRRMQSSNAYECPSLSRLFHDVERVFAIFVLHIKDKDPVTTQLLVDTASSVNKTSLGPEHQIAVSLWAEMPSLTQLFKDKLEVERSDGGLFLEPLATMMTAAPPLALADLLQGKTSPLSSNYDEDLVVMLARLEAIFLFENEDMLVRLNRISLKVLHKIARIAIQDSVMGQCPPKMAAEGLRTLNMIDATDESTTPVEVTETDRNLGRRKGRSTRKTSKGKHPAKRFKRLNSKEDKPLQAPAQQCISKGQLAYAMLYSMRLYIRSQKGNPDYKPDLQVLVGYGLLALEISRHRTVALKSDIIDSEHDWVLKQEGQVCEFLEKNSTDCSPAVELYLETLSKKGLEFYNGAYPLVLLERLCTLCGLNEKLKSTHANDLVVMSANVLLDASNALEKYTLPTSNAFDIFWDVLSSDSHGSKHRDFTLRKLHNLAETFFSRLNVDIQEHRTLLIKVLQQFESIDAPQLLKLVTRDLKLHLARLEKDNSIVEAILCFALHAFKYTRRIGLTSSSTEPWRLNRDFVFSLARKLGLNSLKLFLGKWDEMFCPADIKELLLMFQPQLAGFKSVPPEVTQLVFECLESTSYHSEGFAELLQFFKPEDPSYKLALKKVKENFQSFHMNSLYEFARYHHQQAAQVNVKTSSTTTSTSGKRGKGSGGSRSSMGSAAAAAAAAQMDDETFSIVEKALQKLEDTQPNAVKMEHIDWMFQLCTAGITAREISRHVNFNRMVTSLTQYSKHNAEVLVRVLQNMEKVPSMIKHSEPLASCLIAAYKDHFDRRFSECGHGAYAVVINEMLRARLECKQYVKNGEIQFDAEVVWWIRRIHSSKKKLQKMLDAEFKTKAS